jgi:hypothetical protein
MKTALQLTALSVFLLGGAAAAEELPTSEPVKCYEKAWGHPSEGGFGLTAGQAVSLCGGATDASKVIQCFAEAWAPSSAGGLGLNAGQAVALCKSNSLP